MFITSDVPIKNKRKYKDIKYDDRQFVIKNNYQFAYEE